MPNSKTVEVLLDGADDTLDDKVRERLTVRIRYYDSIGQH